MEDFNCDEMIDRAVCVDRMHATELSIKDDEVVGSSHSTLREKYLSISIFE